MPHLANEIALRVVVYEIVAAALRTYLIVLLPEGCCVHAPGRSAAAAVPRRAPPLAGLARTDHLTRAVNRVGVGVGAGYVRLGWGIDAEAVLANALYRLHGLGKPAAVQKYPRWQTKCCSVVR